MKQESLVTVVLAVIGGCLTITQCAPAPRGDTMAIYQVTRAGVTQEEAALLAEALSLSSGAFDRELGIVEFMDAERFQFVPTVRLGTEASDEDEDATVTIEAFDLEALKGLVPPDEAQSLRRFEEALRAAGLHPDQSSETTAVFSNSQFEIVDEDGQVVANAILDTRIAYQMLYDGVALKGPGAHVSATFGSDGAITQLRHAMRFATQGEQVAIISSETARETCAELFGHGLTPERRRSLQVEAELVYYAPEMALAEVEYILPHYECLGTVMIRDEEAVLLSRFIPAVDDPRYVPTAVVNAEAEGTKVSASVNIEGGKPPYTIEWCSSNTLLEASEAEISYEVMSREETNREAVMVLITNANGISAQASAVLTMDVRLIGLVAYDDPDVDFGTENAVTNDFGHLEKGFITTMQAHGAARRFAWGGTYAWEQDFQEPYDNQASPYPGVDQADIVFYVGHGNGGGFYFEDTTHQDGGVYYTDADGDWGNRDSEWMAIYSCQVLKDEWGGLSRVERWGQEFDGLHILLGFQTNAGVNSQFSKTFANNLMDKKMTIRQAWFSAITSHLGSAKGVAMGPIRPGDWANNYNDHFHLKGTIGPDIRGDKYFWQISS